MKLIYYLLYMSYNIIRVFKIVYFELKLKLYDIYMRDI